MEITNSALRLNAQHAQESRSVSLSVMRLQAEIPAAEARPEESRIQMQTQAEPIQPQDEARLSEDGMKLSAKDALALSIMKNILERLAGHRFQVFEGAHFETDHSPEIKRLTLSVPDQEGIRWSVEITELHWDYEREQSQFQAEGLVHTRDGRQINLKVNLDMAREFESFRLSQFGMRGGPLEDPLVINFDAAAAQLDADTIEFDLTIDGEVETMPFLQPGSGFLVHDPDGQGKVVSGAQLFGPETGQGYQELAQHDEDGNGWIDAGDSLYEELAIWHRDASGHFHGSSLTDMGIGAISLDRIATPFTLTDPQGNTLGQTRKTGLYLGHDGQAGTVQQLDLRV